MAVQQTFDLRLQDASKNSARKLVFISHATPEDNDFARWLAVKLATAGYVVWADVEQLIGGEKFWRDIEDAIRNHAAKVLWCASRKSIGKSGVLRELKIAQETETKEGIDIVVPLRLDDVPFSSFPSGMSAEVNIVSFAEGWASGLKAVIRVLERASVEVIPNARERVVEWWSRRFAADEGVTEGSETHQTNIFPATNIPAQLNFFKFQRVPPKRFDFANKTLPARPYGDGVLTFASAEETEVEFREFRGIKDADQVSGQKFVTEGWPEMAISPDEARKRVYWMIRFGFKTLALSRQFQTYALSQNNECFWLLHGNCHQDEYSFQTEAGRIARRQLVGYNSYGLAVDGVRKRRLWHFAIQPRPVFAPTTALILKTHVVFTSDGKTLIASDSKQHSARRSACKSWWNDAWRDRLLATVAYVSGGSDVLSIPVGADAAFQFAAKPISLGSRRRYTVIEKQPVENLPFEDSDSEEETDYTGDADG